MRISLLTLLLLFTITSANAEVSSNKTAAQIEHIVLLWLKPETSVKQQQAIIDGTKALESLPHVKQITIGQAGRSERPIVDDSFTLGIVMTFNSRSEMESYLIHPQHKSLVNNQIKPVLDKILVYDIVKGANRPTL